VNGSTSRRRAYPGASRRVAGDATFGAVHVALALACGSCVSSPAITPAWDASPYADGDVSETQVAETAGPVGPSEAMAFCARARDQEAAWRQRCWGGDATEWRAFLDNPMRCESFDGLIVQGTLQYHPERAQACLDANRPDRDCLTEATPCAYEVLAGRLATNAPCRSDYECPEDAGCWADSELGYNACRPSTCVHVPQRGESCGQFPYTYCFTGLTCAQGVCVSQSDEGAACGATLPTCRSGLICFGETCGRRIDGGACQVDEECVGTEYCHDTSECLPRIPVGGSCDGATRGCAAFAACDSASMRCVPGGHLGQPCSSTVDARYVCVEGVCRDGTCRPRLPDGASCFNGSDCASNGCSGGACMSCD
jgi:hypothetical protein